MDDAALVRRLEPFGDLSSDRHSFRDEKRARRNAFRERRAFDELEDERLDAIGFVDPVDRGDVGMIQRRGEPALRA